MRKIGLFVEDFAHKTFIESLLKRLAKEQGVEIVYQGFNVRKGHGKAVSELKQFLRDFKRGQIPSQDLLIIVIDANCKGFQECKRELQGSTKNFEIPVPIIYAIPDPHIERWLLLDSAAFKKVTGKGCKAPDKKCEKDRYKSLLMDAFRDASIVPAFGGIEYSEDIIDAMNLENIARNEPSIKDLLQNLKIQFKKWKIE